MYKLASFLVAFCILAVGIILGVLNPVPVSLDLFIVTITVPLSLVMAGMLVSGIFIGAGLIFVQVARLKWALRAQEKKVLRHEDKIVQLNKQISEEKRKLKQVSSTLVRL